MYYEDVSTEKVDAAVAGPIAPGLWTNDDICKIYVRLIHMGLLDPALVSERMMEYYGTRLGHHVRLAREEQEQRARNAEHQRQLAEETARHNAIREMARGITAGSGYGDGVKP